MRAWLKILLFYCKGEEPYLFRNGIFHGVLYYAVLHCILCYMNFIVWHTCASDKIAYSTIQLFKNNTCISKLKCLHKLCLMSFVLHIRTCQVKKKITPQAKMTKDIIILFSLNIVFMCRNIRTKARGYMNTLPSRKHDELINLECDLI